MTKRAALRWTVSIKLTLVSVCGLHRGEAYSSSGLTGRHTLARALLKFDMLSGVCLCVLFCAYMYISMYVAKPCKIDTSKYHMHIGDSHL